MTRIATNPMPRIPAEQRDSIVGSTVTIGYGDLYFDVVVSDHRTAYGHDQWLVTPVAGRGSIWVRNIAPKPMAAL